MSTGRPTDYTEELADKICEGLAQGNSLRTVCKADDMPCAATVFKWLRLYPKFVEQYTRSKEESIEALLEEAIDIADDGTNDWNEVHGKDGESLGWRVNGEHIQRSRLRVETRKWFASKLKPKKYGDKVETTLKGDAEAPLQITVIDSYKIDK